ncbi:hypothetical protein pb186bvf_003668 [Paramecium bursaria]
MKTQIYNKGVKLENLGIEACYLINSLEDNQKQYNFVILFQDKFKRFLSSGRL